MHVSWGEICHFKHPAHFGSKSHDHQDFSREKTRTKPSFSLDQILMPTLTWIITEI